MLDDILRTLLHTYKNYYKKHYTPLNTITINTSGLEQNYDYLTQLNPTQAIFPVLKSNAYGHGIDIVAGLCNKRCPPYVIVDSIPEARHTSKYYDGNVLIIGENSLNNYKEIDYKKYAIAIGSIDLLQGLSSTNKPFRIHLFVDTGMRREGINPKEVIDACEIIRNSCLIFDGIMTHFTMSDHPNHTLTQQQVQCFERAVATVHHQGFSPPWIHCANSGATIWSPPRCTARRTGKALYGYSPFFGHDKQPGRTHKLIPSLTRTSTITKVASVSAGSSISYDATYTTPHDTTLAVLPCGYHEGLPRSASGKLIAQHHDGLCYQRGRICMNLSVWEVPETSRHGDLITLISPSHHQSSVFAMAHHAQTIPYDILVHIERNLIRKTTCQ